MNKQTPNKTNETAAPTQAQPAASCPASAPTGDLRPPVAEDQGLISKQEVARRLKKATRTVERWQRCGVIPYIKCGRAVYYNWPAVVAHLDKHFRICQQPQPPTEGGTHEQSQS
jgi:hypothetical protein